MKKFLIMMLFAGTTLMSKAQNGGISNENASLKIEYNGMTASGQTIVKVTNKDTCTSNVRMQWGRFFRAKDVGALGVDTFILETQIRDCFIRATSVSPCRTTHSGQVEINYCQALPVKFEYVTARRIDVSTIEVEFKFSEVTGTQSHFNINLSTDGKNFRTVSVILPTAAKPNNIYNVKIKI